MFFVVANVFVLFLIARNEETRMTSFRNDMTLQEELAVYYDASYQHVPPVNTTPRGPTVHIGTSLTIDPATKHTGFGREVHRAFTIWLDYVNDVRGGIKLNGKQCSVSLKIVSDLSNGTIVRHAYTSMLSQGYKLFFGPYSSGLNEYAADAVNGTDSVLITSGAASTSVFAGRENVFGMTKPAEFWFRSTLLGMRSHGVNSVLALRSNSAFNTALCSRIEDMCIASNITYINTLVVPDDMTSSDFVETILLPSFTTFSPDMLIGCTSNSLCRSLLPAIQKFDINFKAMAFAQCVTSTNFATDLGDAARFVLGPTPWMPDFPIRSDITDWTANDFALIYAAKYGSEPPYQAASAFSTATSMMHAIELAQSVDPALVALALKNMTTMAILGPVSFDANGMLLSDMTNVQIFADSNNPRLVIPQGKYFPVYPMPPWHTRHCFDRYNSSMQLLNIGLRGQGAQAVCGPCSGGETTNFSEVAWNGSHWGWRCSQSDCTIGQEISFNGTETVCVNCPPGKRGTPGLLCVDCQVGRFFPSFGGIDCHDCPLGRHSNALGLTECIECTAGTEAAIAAAQKCRACSEGTFSNVVGQANCELCPVGTISNSSASTNCSICPAGKYSAWGALVCVDCPVGKHQQNPGHDDCRACTTGSKCIEPGIQRPANLPDWWQYLKRVDDGEYEGEFISYFTACTESGICNEGNTCKEGHLGLVCGSCLPDYDLGTISAECHKCPSMAVNAMVMAVFCCIVCGMSYLVADWAIQGTLQSKNVSSALVKLFINYITTMSFMGLVLYREYKQRTLAIAEEDPSQLEESNRQSKLSSFITIDLSSFTASIFSLECLIMPYLSDSDREAITSLSKQDHLAISDPGNAGTLAILSDYQKTIESRRVILWALIPIVLSVLLVVFGFIALHVHLANHKQFYAEALDFFDKCKKHGWKETFRLTPGHHCHEYMKKFNYRLFGIWRVISLAGKKGKKFRKEFAVQAEPLVIVINFVLFPYVIKSFLRPLSCVEPAGGAFGKRVQSNPAVSCYNNDRLFWGAAACLILYGVGLPILSAFLLWENRDKLDRERYRRTYGFLISGYEVDRNWWECFTLFRKTVGACIATLGMSQHTRIYLMTCASLFFFLMHVFYQPFDNRYKELLDKIEFRHLVAWVVWSLSLLAMHMMPKSTSRETVLIVTISLLAIHVLYFLMIVRHILRHLRNMMAEKLMMHSHQTHQRELMENISHGKNPPHDIVLKQLPQDMVSTEKSCAWLALRQYTRYLDKQPYVAVNPTNMNMTILGNQGSRCTPPPELNQNWIDVIDYEPEEFGGNVRPADKDARSYFLDVIGETFEYCIVNKEINHFSSSSFEFFVRSAFAVGSDGGDRHLVLGLDSNAGAGAATGGFLGMFHAVSAVAKPEHYVNAVKKAGDGIAGIVTATVTLGKKTGEAVGIRKSQIEAKSGQGNQGGKPESLEEEEDLADEEMEKIGTQIETAAENVDDPSALDPSKTEDTAYRRKSQNTDSSGPSGLGEKPEHNTLQAIKMQEQEDKRAQKRAQQKRILEIVQRMYDVTMYLRGVTIQDMQLNLNASICGKSKNVLMYWFDQFEADFVERLRKTAEAETERYMVARGETEEEVPPKEGMAHAETQVKSSDIEYMVAIGALDGEMHKHHGMSAAKSRNGRLMDFDSMADAFEGNVHDSKLAGMTDAGENVYIVAWGRMTRHTLLKANKEYHKNPYYHTMSKVKSKHKKSLETMHLKAFELKQLQEELARAQTRMDSNQKEHDELAADLNAELVEARREHMTICGEIRNLKHAIAQAKSSAVTTMNAPLVTEGSIGNSGSAFGNTPMTPPRSPRLGGLGAPVTTPFLSNITPLTTQSETQIMPDAYNASAPSQTLLRGAGNPALGAAYH